VNGIFSDQDYWLNAQASSARREPQLAAVDELYFVSLILRIRNLRFRNSLHAGVIFAISTPSTTANSILLRCTGVLQSSGIAKVPEPQI
jgi:hypothetical protein